MGRISRVGDRYLRQLLVIGMTSLVRRARIQPALVDLRLSAMQARKPQSGHRGRRQPDGARGLSDHDARRNLPGADHYRSLIWSGREGAGRSPVARAMRCAGRTAPDQSSKTSNYPLHRGSHPEGSLDPAPKLPARNAPQCRPLAGPNPSDIGANPLRLSTPEATHCLGLLSVAARLEDRSADIFRTQWLAVEF